VGKEESTDAVLAKVGVVRREAVVVIGIQQHLNPSSHMQAWLASLQAAAAVIAAVLDIT
jgi:hypothetical protein